MKPTRVPRPVHHAGWVYEEKVAGYRMVARKAGREVRLVSRERGDAAQAIELLEKAVAEATRFRSRQVQADWKYYLAEAYRLNGRFEEARATARGALQVSSDAAYPLGVGAAHAVLGRIAQMTGTLAEAQTCLDQALETLTTIRARYWIARTYLDLASLAGVRKDRAAATRSLHAARALFTAMCRAT